MAGEPSNEVVAQRLALQPPSANRASDLLPGLRAPHDSHLTKRKRNRWPIVSRYLTGLESWLTLRSRPGSPPPPYKMALLTWLTILPLIPLVVRVLDELLERVARVTGLAITTAVTIPLMDRDAARPGYSGAGYPAA
jgi:hypothetical protein